MSEWNDVRRLLVAFLGERGDVRRLLPALRQLGRALPRAGLSWLGTAQALPIEPAFPAFENMVVYPNVRGDVLTSGATVLSLVERVRCCGFDAAIVFTRPGESPWMVGYACYLAGVRLRAGQSVEFGGQVLSDVFEPPADGVDRHVALVEALGLGRY